MIRVSKFTLSAVAAMAMVLVFGVVEWRYRFDHYVEDIGEQFKSLLRV